VNSDWTDVAAVPLVAKAEWAGMEQTVYGKGWYSAPALRWSSVSEGQLVDYSSQRLQAEYFGGPCGGLPYWELPDHNQAAQGRDRCLEMWALEEKSKT
jgi:hypothetical protein